MSLERVQIILETNQRRVLAARAKQTGHSIRDLVCEALDLWMASDKEKKMVREQALETARHLRERIASYNTHGHIPDAVVILDQVRGERTNDLYSS